MGPTISTSENHVKPALGQQVTIMVEHGSREVTSGEYHPGAEIVSVLIMPHKAIILETAVDRSMLTIT